MDPETEVTCPECDCEFRPADRLWMICNGCGRMFDPDDEHWTDHKHRGECTQDLGSGRRAYSEADVREKQQRWIESRRE